MVEKVFKNVPGVVYGNVQVPKGKALSSVEIFYKENYQLDSANLISIKAARCGGTTFDLLSTALFCQDNNFYFSGLTAQPSIVRATFNDGTLLDSLVITPPVSANVSITQFFDWENKTGFSLSVSTPGNNNGITLTDRSMSYLSQKSADAILRNKNSTPVQWSLNGNPSQELNNKISTFLSLSLDLNNPSSSQKYSLMAPEFYLQLINFDRYLLANTPQTFYIDYFTATQGVSIDFNIPDICTATPTFECIFESIRRIPDIIIP